MSAFVRPTFLAVVMMIAIAWILVNSYLESPELPKLEETWWGPANATPVDRAIKPFEINVSESVLTDLRRRLESTRLTPPLEGVQQQYGFNTDTLRKLIDYWMNEYDWPSRQKYLNQFPQYTVNVQGLNIHYVHVKPKKDTGKRTYPLLMLHGWSGSVREFYKIIPMLTDGDGRLFNFEVIVPSLPGFGFSDGAVRPGLGNAQMAVVFRNFMRRLNFDKFFVQGGDFGAWIAKDLATLYPDVLYGLHSNMALANGMKRYIKYLLGALWPPLVVDKKHRHKMYPISTIVYEIVQESGYFHMQATKPDTVGVSLNDSPAGLAAYILDIFTMGTNRTYKYREDAGLLDRYTYDELIDNIMYYWVPQKITTSMRIYSETFNEQHNSLRLDDIPISKSVPCAVARFPYEIMYQTEWILRDKFTNLVQVSDFDEGGHFPALEVPHLLAADIFSAVEKMIKYNDTIASKL